MSDESEFEIRAQRWHDTDHPERAGCWCCCHSCAPAHSARPNPFYRRARLMQVTRDDPHGWGEG